MLRSFVGRTSSKTSSETNHLSFIVYLHKPAFSQALLHYPEEPLKSPWAPSVKAVVLEAGVYVVAIAGSWINLDPILCPRWW